MTTTVRISTAAQDLLKQVAQERGLSIQGELEEAIELYRRRLFVEEVNAGYASLRQDEAAWVREQDERAAWETTLQDGLDGD